MILNVTYRLFTKVTPGYFYYVAVNVLVSRGTVMTTANSSSNLIGQLGLLQQFLSLDTVTGQTNSRILPPPVQTGIPVTVLKSSTPSLVMATIAETCSPLNKFRCFIGVFLFMPYANCQYLSLLSHPISSTNTNSSG